jgi:hypothetical protein
MLLYHLAGNAMVVGVLDLRSGTRTELLRNPVNAIAQAHFSPDMRLIAFHSDIRADKVRLFVVPYRPAQSLPEADWIPVSDGATVDRDACWSPGGNLLYYSSERDGFRCVWAQRLDSATRRPLGSPFAILHLHSRRRSLGNVPLGLLSISVASDRIAFPLGEVTGDIWRAEWK